MKQLFIILSLIFSFTTPLWANGGEQFPFHVGEKLTYQIFWGPFVVGRASLEVVGIEQVDGHDCYHIVAKAKTGGLTDWMFPVDNRIDSWLDVESLFTRKYLQNRHEGKSAKNDETHYNYDQGQAVTRNLKNGKVRRSPLEQPVQDVISSLYYVRTRNLILDSEQSFVVNASDVNYKVTIRPDERKELWVRPVGDVHALRVEPNPTLKIVAANKGRMWFWVTDDARRLPLIVHSAMKIGSAKLVLFKIDSANPALDRLMKSSATAIRAQSSSPTGAVVSRH